MWFWLAMGCAAVHGLMDQRLEAAIFAAAACVIAQLQANAAQQQKEGSSNG